MNESQSVTPFWQDKGLWCAVLAPVFVWLNQKFGLTLSAEAIVGLLLPIAIYIAGHKYKSAQIVIAEINAKAVANVAAKPVATPADAVKDAIK